MKLLIAYLRPARLDHVLRALAVNGVLDVSYSDARGYSRRDEAGAGFSFTFLPKVRLTAVVEDDCAAAVADALVHAARSGRQGDGEVLILSGSGV